jgi:hypothetical protein
MSNTQPIGRVMLRDVRLSFPALFEATTVAGEGKPRFGASLLVHPDHPQLAEVNAKIEAVARDKWKDKAASVLAGLRKTDKVALHDGDTKPQYDGYAGNFFISANSQENAPPTVVGADRAPLTAKSGKPYAGCYVNASLEFWAQDNQYGKRVNCTLRGVQFVRDGDAFSAGRPADADEFDVVEGAEASDFA